MDIVHHTFIGGTGFLALAANDQELAGMAFVAGSVFPDLDVVFIAFGKRAYLRNHQGPTHSLLLAPLYALMFIAVPLCLPIGFEWPVLFAALLGLWLHSLLDLTNTFGITVFWPISARRYCFDAVFFIDLVAWSLTVACYVGEVLVAWPYTIACYAASFATYVAFKFWLHSRVQRQLECRHAIPSALHPFHFFVLDQHDGSVQTYVYNALTRRKYDKVQYPPVDARYQTLAEQSYIYRDMLKLTKHFRITEVQEIDTRTLLTVNDLGIRNFGGKFGRTILTFDADGKLIDEMAYI